MEDIIVKDAERKVLRDVKQSLGSDINRYLGELITNSDDSYKRLETKNPELKDKLKPIIIKLDTKKRVLSVIDNAEGMNMNTLIDNFGTYGDSKAGGTSVRSRGIFGQGASDVMRNASRNGKKAEIISFFDGNVSGITYKYEGGNQFKISPKEINRRDAENLRKNLGIPNNGTYVSIIVPEEVDINPKTIVERIESFYMFRYIFNSPNRDVRIVLNNQEHKLDSSRYSFKEADYLDKYDFKFNFDEKEFACHLKLYKNEYKDKQQRDQKTHILVVDQTDVIFANTMFGYEMNSRTKYLSGELFIDGLYKECEDRLNKSFEAIINDNRTGFDVTHDFYKTLKAEIEPILSDVFDKHGNKSAGKTITNNKKLSEVMNKINEYFNEELQEDISGGSKSGFHLPANGLRFVRDSIKITKDKTYSIKLLVNTNQISINSIIDISSNSQAIKFAPGSLIVKEEKTREDGLCILDVSITGIKNEEEIVLTANCNNYSTELLISVIPYEIHYPENGFSFYPSETRITPSDKHKVFLYFDKEIIPIGTNIELKSSDNISLENCSVETTSSMLIDSQIGKVCIKFNNSEYLGECNIFAVCDYGETDLLITVAKLAPKQLGKAGLISSWETEDGSQEEYRGYFNEKEQKIFINRNNLINQKYFGDFSVIEKDNPKNTKKEYYYLFDLISEICAKLLIDKRIEKGGTIGSNDNEEYYQQIVYRKYEIYKIATKVIDNMND